MKEEQSKYRRRVLANEGGLPPDPPKFTEAMMSAMEIMGQELSINDISFVSATMPNANKDGPTHMATTGRIMQLRNLIYSFYPRKTNMLSVMIIKSVYVN